MLKIGYTLSSEEFGPKDLLKTAQLAEEVGFDFAMISDHFHPWVDEQGQSPFVWNMIGALSQVTKRIEIGIGVNCPIIRYNPVIVAQAAATSQVMLEGRFVLGIGTGENLNEHVVGLGWPPYKARAEMIIEAIEILRQLWLGDYQSYYGENYIVDNAKLYTLPTEKIPILVSAFGKESALLSAKYGDGFIGTSSEKELLHIFSENGGRGKPKYGQMNVCFAKDVDSAKKIVLKKWPIAGIPHPLNTELKLPSFFKNVASLVTEETFSKKIPLGSDSEAIIDSIHEYHAAGYDHIYIHNIGPYQDEFIRFCEEKILPSIK